MSEKFKSTKRCYLIDHHSPQPPIVPLGHMDIEEYDHFFETANIDSLMVYCKDHWGVTYYDSKVSGAQKHAGVEGDWIRAVRDKTAEKGIEFVAYYCIEYDEGAARRFPEWRVRKADGTPLIRDDLYAKWSLMCYQTGYREYALSQLEEIVSNYHPDSLFLDIFGASLCYCDNCRSKFEKRFGYMLPEYDADIQARKNDITAFLDDNAAEFYDEMSRRLKAIDPTLAITINFSCHYPKYIRDKLNYQYSEPLLKDNWFSSAYARDTAVGLYPMLAPGEASAVYNYDKTAQYICDLSSIAAQGCRVGMYSGSQHIDGTLEHEESRRLGAVFHELKALEPYLTQTRRPVRSVGIIQSDASKAAGPDAFQADAIIRMKRHSPHTDAILGAMIACEQAKVPYTVLPVPSVTDELLADYDLILLPEVYVTTPELVSTLKAYVEKGGNVITSGKTGLMGVSVEELTGTSFVCVHDEYAQNDWSAYLKAVDPAQFTGLMACTTPPVSDFFVETKLITAQPLAHFALPSVACSPTEWINWWSPPPGEISDITAVTINCLGKGSVINLAFDYFTMSQKETYRDTADFFRDLLRILDICPTVKNVTDIPDILRTAFFEKDDCYEVHQVSTIPNRYHGNTMPVSGGKLLFTKPISGASVVYPNKAELDVVKTDEGWEVNLPSFESQQFIVCKK